MIPSCHWEGSSEQRLQVNPSCGQRLSLQSTAYTAVLFFYSRRAFFSFVSVLKTAAFQVHPVSCNLQKQTRPVDTMWQVSQNHCPFNFMDELKATRSAFFQDMPVIKAYLVLYQVRSVTVR